MKRRVLLQLSAMALILSMLLIPGVQALWIYNEVNTTLPAAPLSAQVPLSLNFSWGSWSGEEELPSDIQGQNHEALVDAILNSTAGLNGGAETLLNEAIAYRNSGVLGSHDEVGSMDSGRWFTTTGAALDAALGLNQGGASEYLSYIIQWECHYVGGGIFAPEYEYDRYYIYTTTIDLGENGAPNIAIRNNIYEIYKTTVEADENGKWVATDTVVGYAPSAYYVETSIFGLNPTPNQIPSFDVSQFQEGKLGTGINDAIWVYDGYSNYLYPDTSATSTYFRFNNAEAGTSYNFTVAIAQTATPNISMTLYNSAGTAEGAPTLNSITTQQETVTNEDGTTTTRTFYVYSFTCTRQSAGEFYFSVKGDLAMWFNFEKATN